MIAAMIDAAVDRSRTILLVLLFILLAGITAYAVIPKESSPDITLANIYITVPHEGISPSDAERLLIRPAEKELLTLEGVKHVKAFASEGSASLRVEYEAGFDADKALQDVREKVDMVKPEWPDGTEEPVIVQEDFSLMPILNVVITGDVNNRTLFTLARNVKDKIEALPSVLTVKDFGMREDVVEIIVDPLILESYNLSPADVLETVRRNNMVIPAGQLETTQGNYAIKVPGLVETIMDLRDVPVKVNRDTVITLTDVSDIRRTYKSQQTVARANGQASVTLSVSKRAGANIIETVEAVQSLVAEESKQWPSGMRVSYANDASHDIRDMLSDLQNSVILAIVLVVVVIIAMMGLRSAALVAISIPGALLLGILCLALMGTTMNIVVLFSLILSVGMLVDAAIVVTEYADRRLIEGDTPREAYTGAAKTMAWPIISSTITTLAVFMPLLFWPDFVGEFMRFLPITLIATLSGSLLMALIFVPSIGAVFGKKRDVSAAESKAMRAKENGDFSDLHPFTRRYVGLLDRLLNRPGLFAVGMLAALIIIFVLYGMLGKGTEFFPDVEPRNATVTVRSQPSLSIEEKDALVRQVEALILPKKEIRIVTTSAGNVADIREKIGTFQLEFVDWKKRRSVDTILAEIREEASAIPGITIETAKMEGGPPKTADIELEVRSRSQALLDPVANKILSAMKTLDGLVEVRDDRPVPEIEWELKVNRELAGKYGLNIASIGNFVKLVTNGIKASEYRPDDVTDEVDILVRFPEKNRTLQQLDHLKIYTEQGPVPIGNFVNRIPAQRIHVIRRVDGLQVVNITANVAAGYLASDLVAQLAQWKDAEPAAPGVEIQFRGESEDQAKAASFLGSAFIIALFAMTLILITQFNSIYSALVVMSAVFFSTGGVLLGLLVTGQTFGIVMCGVGVIALAGIVVNNNIIFIDTFQQLRQEGKSMREALLFTGAQRFRPILLTAGTTVLGLLPMVIGMNINFISGEVTFGAPSSQWWNQLSTSIAGGLAFATILTLLFTPCLLMMGHNLHQRIQRKRSTSTQEIA